MDWHEWGNGRGLPLSASPASPAWGPGADAAAQWCLPVGPGALVTEWKPLGAAQSGPKVLAALRHTASSKPSHAAMEGLLYKVSPGYAHGEEPREPDRFAGWRGCGRGHQG